MFEHYAALSNEAATLNSEYRSAHLRDPYLAGQGLKWGNSETKKKKKSRASRAKRKLRMRIKDNT
jgi:hypothetical protein